VLSWRVCEERRLLGLVGGGLEVVGGGAAGKVAGEDWLKEGAEDDLRASSLWESHPEDEDELEGVVEWEPVDGINGALEEGQERINDPVSQPLGIIGSLGGEQSIERVVGGDREADCIN